MEKDLSTGKLNPRDAKAQLARELVRIYHGEKSAAAAEDEFNRIHKNKEMPDEKEIAITKINKLPDFPEFGNGQSYLPKLVLAIPAAVSMREAKDKINQGGVKINGVVTKDFNYIPKKGDVIQVGKLIWRKLA